MRILFIAPRLHPNQQAWIETLTQQGYFVKYLVSYSLPGNERFDSVEPVVVCGSKLPRWYQIAIFFSEIITRSRLQIQYKLWPNKEQIYTEIHQFQPDIIIIRETFTPLSLTTQRYAKKHKVPSVQYSQSPLTKNSSLFIKSLRALKIIPVLKMTPVRESGSSLHRYHDTFYVPLFVLPNLNNRGEDTDELKILFVGKFNSRRKNHLMLLDALGVIIRNYKVTLTMIGSTVFHNQKYFQEIKDRIVELGLESAVTILTDIPPEKMNAVYQQHDVFLLPSVNEPFSISPLEAMANGIPAIVTDSNGCRGHIIDGENGFVIPSNDKDALISIISKCLDNKKLSSLQSGALTYTRDHNNEQLFMSDFTAMIENVLKDATILKQPNSEIHE